MRVPVRASRTLRAAAHRSAVDQDDHSTGPDADAGSSVGSGCTTIRRRLSTDPPSAPPPPLAWRPVRSPPVSVVTVEPVESKPQLRRFTEIPFVLHGRDPRWSAGVRAWDAWRLDARRHPYFDGGDAAYFLARIDGQPIGRIAAHHAGPDQPGRFGFYDAPEDADVVAALVQAALDWLDGEGRGDMVGPVSWTAAEEAGVLATGADRGAVTGRAWNPGHYVDGLHAAGARVVAELPTFELAVDDPALPDSVALEPGGTGARPPHAGRYLDPALVFVEGAAVPDVAGFLAATSVRGAWRAARTARDRAHETAVVVRVDGDPAVVVPGLVRAARRAGYASVLSPWAPDDRPPVMVHRTVRLSRG